MYKDTQGRFLTQALFFELSYQDPKYAIYTLKDEDLVVGDKIYISIKRLYLEIADPTEYEFATRCFSGWNHWQRILEKTTILHPYIEEWRSELEVKLRSSGVKRMIMESIGDSRSATTAAKWLADKGWQEPRSVGRPRKDEAEAEKAQQEAVMQEALADLKRISH